MCIQLVYMYLCSYKILFIFVRIHERYFYVFIYHVIMFVTKNSLNHNRIICTFALQKWCICFYDCRCESVQDICTYFLNKQKTLK